MHEEDWRNEMAEEDRCVVTGLKIIGASLAVGFVLGALVGWLLT